MKLSKKTALSLGIALLAFSSLSAQNLQVMRNGYNVRPDGITEYSIASTTIVVDLEIRRESVATGPYARFAQRHFGVIAPLSDKDTYQIVAARVGYLDGSEVKPASIPCNKVMTEPVSHIDIKDGFPRILPDKISLANKNPEDAASTAAQAIFSIRKRRMDLITGEYAETVYGEGLQYAIERLDKMENEYLELFFGKQTASTYNVRLAVTPDAAKNTYVVCRYSEAKGLLPDGDLSGQPILLELRPEGMAAAMVGDMKKIRTPKGAEMVEFSVADNVFCRVLDGKRELGSATIPVYQYGVTASLPVH